MSISDNIKKIRSIYGITQKQLADIAGVTDKAVSTWELGTNEPRMGAIQRIADHFNLLKSNIIEDDGMDNIEKTPQLNLSRDASIKLDSLVKMVSIMSDDEWSQLMGYANLILKAKQVDKVDQSSPPDYQNAK